MNTKLGGCLVGYALHKKNGVFRKVIFDKPIHNTITKSCLNNLLMFNGNNDQPTQNYYNNFLSQFVTSEHSSERYGVFNSSALGNGTGATAVTDTDLHNRVGNYTFTKKTGSGWCGTSMDGPNGIIKLRISHTHTITDNFSIKEIGWFNRIYPSGVYSLSSRVSLDNPVDVENGDTFYSIYEVHIGLQGVKKFYDFGGTGKNGYIVNSCFASSSTPIFPAINTNGWGNTAGDYGRAKYLYRPVYLFGNFNFYQGAGVPLSTYPVNENKQQSIQPATYYPVGISGTTFTELKSYTVDSFYRDVVFSVTSDYFVSNPVWNLIIAGLFIRFGTFDEQDNFTPEQVTFNNGFKFTYRESWSTDLLTPVA